MDNIIVNIQTYGDFDMPVSALLMVAPDGMSIKSVRLIVEEVEDNNKLTSDPDNAIKELKANGFKVCKAFDLSIGGEL